MSIDPPDFYIFQNTVDRRLSERLLYGASNIRNSFFFVNYMYCKSVFEQFGDSLKRQIHKNAWNKLRPDLEAEKDFNNYHRKEITDFVQSIPRFQECNAEDSGFQMLNDDEIVTSAQEESNPVDDKMDEDEDNNNNECSKGPSNADTLR
ncbi:uncharacterized protein TNCV_2139461 [Trichonephila clavipes]|uniref:Uncharacterized protein n=1 Tax=Trichonephila clavipes TaxID=2585209 RepID=A0A8X6VAM9_TRICX|nr:uncharacterized protein TNCV_2139461 [Trichonephila clavipes]